MLYIKHKQKKTNEYAFLNRFVESSFFNQYAYQNNNNYLLIQEPYTGIGYPDLVCIIWDKKLSTYWNENRNNLKIDDIKILHYLYKTKQKKSIDNINVELGYSLLSIEKSFDRLLRAELVNHSQDNFSIKPINQIFYIKKIISIEAKLANWRKAQEQALNNCLFSSDSFVLFPEKIINSKLLHAYSESEVGIISFEKDFKIVKKAKINQIPSSFHSWQFNEYIGRKLWKEKFLCLETMN